MELFTEEQRQQLLANGTNSNETSDFVPVVKLFLTWTDCTWLLSELDPNQPDIAFGLCDLGFGFPELGYVSLSEIMECESGLSVIERDINFEGLYPLSAYSKAAREMGFIVTDEYNLRKFNPTIKP